MKTWMLCAALMILATPAARGAAGKETAMTIDVTPLEKELVAKHGDASRERIHRGLSQMKQFWRKEDGDAAAFATLAREHFIPAGAELDELFSRMQAIFESVDGHFVEIGRDLRKQSDLDLGAVRPYDEVMAGWDPSAHFTDDLFANKLAFDVLLNFPITTLDQRLAEGDKWTRRQWAETRLAERFSRRVPAEVAQSIARSQADSAAYIASYNVWMHHVLDEKGNRLFPAKLRLLSHWNLRDEIKAEYAEKDTGLAKQRVIQKVMESIVTQTIPDSVVDNPNVDWNPWTGTVVAAAEKDSDAAAPKGRKPGSEREPDRRYAQLLEVFHAQKLADPWSPTAPTLIDRRFNENRQIPEKRFRKMLEDVLGSPLAPRVAALTKKKLGRDLEPFDIWYNGFTPRGAFTESDLDAMTKKKYPTAAAYAADMPSMLKKLGFDDATAAMLAGNIVVDPARGSGHALGAGRREDHAHLRTRVEKDGMNYKGYNIAVHEMGHNVEQTFSLNKIDYYTLSGVPNNAFTEALAFVFQGHDLELLGMSKADPKAKASIAVNDFWMTFEIAGVALVDMDVWHWMYDHPKATPAELREATVKISRDVWNKWYAPLFGKKDVVLLGIYSHMIDSVLYLPDYPIGHMIAFQVEEQMEKEGKIGPAFERMAKAGNIAPDLWMKQATGAPVGPEALLSATESGLKELETK